MAEGPRSPFLSINPLRISKGREVRLEEACLVCHLPGHAHPANMNAPLIKTEPRCGSGPRRVGPV